MVCKPFAKFDEMAKSVDWFSGDLTKSDFVIVLAGINNDDISVKSVSALADKCFFTNLILCGIPVNVKFCKTEPVCVTI